MSKNIKPSFLLKGDVLTPYGAAVYTRFYGRPLRTQLKLLYLIEVKNETLVKPSEPSSGPSGMMTDMNAIHRQTFSSFSDQQALTKILSPVINFKPNTYGVRGLAENVSEWGTAMQAGSAQKDEESQYVILPSMNPRQPWEVFEEVGFRIVKSIPRQDKWRGETSFESDGRGSLDVMPVSHLGRRK